MKKLFLLDAMALIYRAHFAFIRTPRINSKDINTSAVFGFTNVLLDIMKKDQPTHLAIVYDTGAPTFRHEQYSEYKAGRQETPEDITIAIPYIHKMADAFGIPNISLDGYEADDLIGTLAKKAAREGYLVYMMTPDKDYGQLVEENILQLKPAYAQKPAEVYGIKEIQEKWGIETPLQVIDILALMGDSIDNIPGVPGVGEKTAAKLIKEYGSVENLIFNIDKLSGKLKESIMANMADLKMSKELATIKIDCPINFDEQALLMSEPNYEELKIIFEELEFKTLMTRVIPGMNSATPKTVKKVKPGTPEIDLFNQTEFIEEDQEEKEEGDFLKIGDIQPDYKLINSAEERQQLITYLKTSDVLSFDTETTGLNPHLCDMVGMSFAIKEKEAFYVSVPKEKEEIKKIVQEFKELMEDENILKLAQNIKFDMLIFKNYDVEVKGPMYDTMLAHYIFEPEMRHNMDLLSRKYLNYDPIAIETLLGKKGKNQLNMSELDPMAIKDYAAEDADVVLQLKPKLDPLLKDNGGEKVFYEVEMPLVPVLASMEREGVNIDRNALQAYSVQLRDEMIETEKQVYELAGMNFNINSPAQLGEVLFDKLELDPNAKRTSKSKQYSTNEEVLSQLALKHDIAQKILDFRGMQKLKSTYVDALPLLINPITGRVHTSYNQAVAATGRLSSTDPNVQNIPIRTDRGKEIRKAFIPRNDDYLILSADYSQIELRLIAELSVEENMIQAFHDKVDIHTATSARIFGVPLDEVTSDMRRKAKMVNFGIIYGISAFGLAQRLRIPRSEAAQLIEQYNAQYPGIKRYLQTQVEFAREHGYVETLMGRRRYLRDINSANATQRGFAERNAVNAPIQGSAADMIKLAMIKIHAEMSKLNLRSKMVLQVHDELVFDVHKTELDLLKPIVESGMRNALDLKIPIEVEMGSGINWLEAH